MKGKRISLSVAWQGLIALLIFLPLAIFIPWFGSWVYSVQLQNALTREALFNAEIKDHIRHEFARLVTLLQNKSDPMAYTLAHTLDQTLLHDLLKAVLRREPAITALALVGRDGRAVATRSRHGRHARPWDRAAPEFTAPMHGRSHIGAPRATADGRFECRIAVPVGPPERPLAALIATIDVQRLWRSIHAPLSRPDVTAYVVDSRGRLLIRPPGAAPPPGTSLADRDIIRTLLAHGNWDPSATYRGLDGRISYGVATWIDQPNWIVVSEIAREDVVHPILTNLLVLGVIVSVLVLAVGALGMTLVHRMTQPIIGLSTAFDRAARGEYLQQLPPSKVREFHILATGFNHMMAEIKRREDTLRKLSRAMESAAEGIIVTDAEGRIEYVNPAFTEITGFSPQEAIGRRPAILKSGKQDAAFYRAFWQTIKRGRSWSGRLVNRRKDGSLFPARLTVSPIKDENGKITHFVGIHEDLTEAEEMEARLRQAQKMESLGTLVGGIAHDFNNMLAGMLGNLYLAKREAAGRPELIRRLERIEATGHRAADMIRNLLAFARKGGVELKPLPLVPFLKESFKLARVSVPENIRTRLAIDGEDLVIRGDAAQLQQVLLNLIANAKQAVADVPDPSIQIRLTAVDPDAAFIRRHPGLAGRRLAHWSVTDNGCGIPEKDLDKIFEPFFTSKAVGEGTGLGLSMVYGAVRQHGGAIEVESRVGQGTTVHIYLPLTSEKVRAGGETAVAEGRGETILLADDEAAVRDALKETLESLAYRVLTAENGRKALALFESHRDEVELALLDVVMPEMGGVEAARRMREQRPDLPLIFVTGYDKERALAGTVELPGCRTLAKPIAVEEISQTIRKMLDGA